MKITTQKLTSLIHKVPTKSGLFVAIAATVAVTGNLALAYGPERQTYTIERPADHITFNSITNNPNYGDERNFTIIKDASNTSAGGWTDNITVENGKEYLVRMYVHNNAAANLNLVAKNTRVMANLPTAASTKAQIDGFITADNATPAKIWDSVVMTSDKKFNIGYVNGSATYYNNVKPGGQPLPDSIVTSAGAKVGYNSMDGNVPGCFEYSGIATFKVKVQMESPDFTVEKKVRINGTSEWAKSVTAQPGQKVDYQIGYKNTGTNAQENVLVKDQLPANVAYQQDSTTLKNATNSNGNGLKLTSNALTTGAGVNIGNYTAGSNAFVRFTATIPTADKLICGENKLTNVATIYTANGSKSDSADVIVKKTDCAPGETPAALPTTGPVEVIAGLFGLAAVTFGTVYYFKSRRELKDVLHAAQSGTSMTRLSGTTDTKLDAVEKDDTIPTTDK